MLIDFHSMEETVIPNFLGGEGAIRARMFVDERNRILHGVLEPGCSIGCHTHDTSSEIIYILSGTGKMLCDGVYEDLTPGVCTYCPKGHQHSLMNDNPEGSEDLVFFAVVPEQ